MRVPSKHCQLTNNYFGFRNLLFYSANMGLDEDFTAAANKIRGFSKRPSDSDMLEVYALYKQATVGDTNTPKPSGAEASAKWNAWSGKKGLSSNEAKQQYIAKVNALAPKFA